MITDINPRIPEHVHNTDTYEIYVNVYVNEQSEDDPYGPRVSSFTRFIKDKADTITALNELNNVSDYNLSRKLVTTITNDSIRDQLLDVMLETDRHLPHLFITNIAVAYYDQYGRKCFVAIEEE